jgi:hypothetical protein
MSGAKRRRVPGALAILLLAGSLAACQPTQGIPGGQVSGMPGALLGQWDGDVADYHFAADGSVSITGIGQGRAEVVGSQITFQMAAAESWTLAWQVDPCADPSGYGYPFRVLHLGQYSYVQEC